MIGYVGVAKALAGKPLSFNDFLDLTRKAEIPYPLFFAPRAVVDAQIQSKVDKLMSGFQSADGGWFKFGTSRQEFRQVRAFGATYIRELENVDGGTNE